MEAGFFSLYFGVDILDPELQEKMGTSIIIVCRGSVGGYDLKIR